MKIIYFILTFFIFSSLFSSCNRAVDNWNPRLEQLKQETLNSARDCSDELATSYENEINNQSKSLSAEELERSLKNMKEDITCE